eukprot:1307742-Rhodomonas_salina.4
MLRKMVGAAISLRAPYAMSGTDLAYAAICLRAPYAMSGSELAYVRRWYSGVCCYAKPGTEIAYAATIFQHDVQH